MDVLLWIAVGLVAGGMARLLIPISNRGTSGVLMDLIGGLVGGILGGYMTMTYNIGHPTGNYYLWCAIFAFAGAMALITPLRLLTNQEVT